jgi:hypothetical protein
MKDIRSFSDNIVTVYAIQCHSGDFETPLLEDEEQVFFLWDQHYAIRGHTDYWTYTIQRGKVVTMEDLR